jgi:hypothetical protein
MGRARVAVLAGLWAASVVCAVGGARAQGASEPPATGPMKLGPDGQLVLSDDITRRIPPGKVKLSYQLGPRTAGCDKEATFRKWAVSHIGLDPFVPAGAPTHELTVAMERDADGGFRGLVELRDVAGNVLFRRRPLERSCVDLSDKIVIDVLTSMFWPERGQERCENACTKKLEEQVDALTAKVEELRKRYEEQVAARQKEARRHEEEMEELRAGVKAMQGELKKRTVVTMDLTGALSAGALITANLTPNVGPAVQVGGELRAGPFSFGLDLRSILPSRVQVGPAKDPDRYDVSQYVALAVPCGRYSYFFGCVVAGAGFQFDAAPAGQQSFVHGLLQLGGRLGVEIPFAENRFAVRGFGEVLYSTPGVRLHYYLDGVSIDEWDRPDVSALFGVGLVVKLGNQETR